MFCLHFKQKSFIEMYIICIFNTGSCVNISWYILSLGLLYDIFYYFHSLILIVTIVLNWCHDQRNNTIIDDIDIASYTEVKLLLIKFFISISYHIYNFTSSIINILRFI